MIQINNLSKFFKIKDPISPNKNSIINALDNINLNIKKNEIFGIIGPNGAGKTTLAKILSTLIIPDEGTVFVNNINIEEKPNHVKNITGLLPGEYSRSFYWRLSGYRNLHFFAKLRGVKNPDDRIDYLLDLFNLKDKKNDLVMKYSTGMKHKLALAIGLIHDPPVLFLDEPLTGIDPVTAKEIKNIVRTKFSDKTIIWTSHNLFEIEEMCDRIALLNKGKIILQGEPENIKKKGWDHKKILIESEKPDRFLIFNGNKINDRIVEIKTKNVHKTVIELANFAEKNNIEIIDIRTVKPSLEDIFLKGVEENV